MTNDRLDWKKSRRPVVLWAVCIPVIVICCVIIVGWWWCWTRPITTVMLVRHAERTAGDALTSEGQVRAQVLVHVAGAADLDEIYVTEFQRTQQTAAPLATAVNLTPVQMAANDWQAVADDILINHRGDRVMVVGHSNTVPRIIEALGGPSMGDLNENEFDNLFVLVRCGHLVRLIELHYGAPLPP